jgi:hypothetical protein
MNIYVASSWRNDYQPEVVRALREVGHDVYDFRKPSPEDRGFHWFEIDPEWETWTTDQFVEHLSHPLARTGFARDMAAIERSSACVLVLPCGRSSHLEAGWFAGRRKPLLILTAEIEPELMYGMADSIHAGLGPLLLRLQEIEES